VEPVIGQLKICQNLTMMSRRGLIACDSELLLAATAHNMRKLPGSPWPCASHRCQGAGGCFRGYGLDTTVALTTMAVLVTVSCPVLARARIMLSLVSTLGVTPGFHRMITVRHSGE